MKKLTALFALLLSVVTQAVAADFTGLTIGSGFAVGGAITASTFALDESGDYLAFAFQCEEAATITKLDFRYGARTGTLQPPTYQIDLEGIDLTNGRPDGTVKSSTNAKQTFLPPNDTTWDGTWRTNTLTSSYTCTRGEHLAAVIKYTSGTISATQSSTFGQYWSNLTNIGGANAFPYALQHNNTGATFAKQDYVPLFAYESASKIYGYPGTDGDTTQFSSDSTPNEYALNFSLSSSFCSTFTLKGAQFVGRTDAATKTFKVLLYSGTSVIATVGPDSGAFDSDALVANSGYRAFRGLFTDTTLPTLTCGSTYRISLQPQETASNVNLNSIIVNANSDLAAWPGGIGWYLSTRTGAGWTDVTTKRPLIDLIIGDWTAPSGGGLKVHPGMNGGANG